MSSDRTMITEEQQSNEEWQQLLIQGNQWFNQHQWRQAQHCYLQALDLLNVKCHQSPTCIGSLMAWIGTCHNLSTLHERMGDLQQALVYLQLPHQHCRNQLQHHESEEVQLIALKSLNLCWSAIVGFAKNNADFMCTQDSAIDGITPPSMPAKYLT